MATASEDEKNLRLIHYIFRGKIHHEIELVTTHYALLYLQCSLQEGHAHKDDGKNHSNLLLCGGLLSDCDIAANLFLVEFLRVGGISSQSGLSVRATCVSGTYNTRGNKEFKTKSQEPEALQ